MRLNPDAWTDRQKVEHSGEVRHAHAGVMLELSTKDILLLDEEKQRQLVALVEEVGNLKGDEDGPEDRELLE